MSSISRYPRKNRKSKILAYSDFALASCARVMRVYAPAVDLYQYQSMLKILSNDWQFSPNEQVLATLLQDFLFFIRLQINQNNSNL